MIPRTFLTALLLSTVAVGTVTAEPSEMGGDGPAAAEFALGADPDPAVTVAVTGLVGWLWSRPLLRGLLLAGAAAVGLVLARAGYRRARDRYRAHTSPTVVLLDDDLEEFEWDDAASEASDRDDGETDDPESRRE